MIGEDGGDTMGRTIFVTTLHCHYELLLLMSLCYVNNYHKNFLYGGLLKVIVLYCSVLYCIVLYCIVLYCLKEGLLPISRAPVEL